MVMTTYPGASPEEVETVVSKPVEQAMATVSNIENIQSVSSENMSMVILQFAPVSYTHLSHLNFLYDKMML